MIDGDELRERVNSIVQIELPELKAQYDSEGWGIDSYAMALAHCCGKHSLPPDFAAKLDNLYYRGRQQDRSLRRVTRGGAYLDPDVADEIERLKQLDLENGEL